MARQTSLIEHRVFGYKLSEDVNWSAIEKVIKINLGLKKRRSRNLKKS